MDGLEERDGGMGDWEQYARGLVVFRALVGGLNILKVWVRKIFLFWGLTFAIMV